MSGTLSPTIVRASAGTGKTYQLTARLLRILLQGAAPESVLATTFTRKAAGEILSRVMLDLAKAADPDQPESLEKLRQQVQIETLPRSVAAELLVKVVRSVHRLRVCTLDSLFSQLARSFAFELDLPPGWRLSDEIEEATFQSAAISALVGRMDASQTSTLLAMLAKGDNKRSISRELSEVVSSAYAMSRAAHANAWQTLTAPKSPLAKAGVKDDVWPSIASDLLAAAEASDFKRHSTKLKKLAELAAAADQDKLVADGLVEKIGLAQRGEMPVFHARPFESEAQSPLQFIYSLAKTQTLGLLVGQNDATGQVLSMYGGEIELIKRDAAALSFDDVSSRLASGLASIDADLLQTRMDGNVDHLLLDEFQDTSPVQWEVLRPMAIHAANVDGDLADDQTVPRSFFCVGDTKQAIYGWRGGVAEIFDAVAKQIPGIDERTQDLSFRSSPIITNTVNAIFKQLARHPMCDAPQHTASADHYEAIAVKAFADRFPDHKTARSGFAGYFEFCTAPDPVPDTGADGKPSAADRQSAVLDHASEKIRDLWTQMQSSGNGGTIGVLTRTNRSVGEMIRRLSAMGVDVSQEGGNPLTDSAAVQMILSALLMAEHPGDGRWAFHLSQTNLSQAEGWTSNRIRRMIADVGLVQTIDALASVIAPSFGQQDTMRLKQLASLAISYEHSAGPRIRDFVNLVNEKRIARPRQASVRVMTVHQSKGLEFEAVVLPEISGELVLPSNDPVADVPDLIGPPTGLSRSLPRTDWHFLPARWRAAFGNNAAGRMTEALCLMYVAITRSKQALYLIAEPNSKMAQKKTMAGLVAAAMQIDENTGDANIILSSNGDPDWFAAK